MVMRMQKYIDFRQRLQELRDKHVELRFYVLENTTRHIRIGWIRELNDHSITFEDDPAVTDLPLKERYLNLEAIIVYDVGEIPEDADLTRKEESEHVGEATEYIPYDEDGKPVREPQDGYVVLHKDHIYAKGTVYTKIPSKEEDVHPSETLEERLEREADEKYRQEHGLDLSPEEEEK